ncbi:glucosaminidase domain-containing protein [Kurthia zopfii]|uniref:glucosaminidase domain-containing protein n=2 Tax=Kurthia zopfii TaxID=1650 RepID=UPI0035A24885
MFSLRKFAQLTVLAALACVVLIFSVLLLVNVFSTSSEPKTNAQHTPSQQFTQKEFIQKIAPTAEKIAEKYGLYASVMIAQATLESNSGNSELASTPNYNLFGMKGSYRGNSVRYPTQEDDGKGNMRTINANFRQYPSYEESMKDYAKLLQKGTSWNKEIYHKTFVKNSKSYKEATAALTGRYATDSKYNHKLNQLIKDYKLSKYDTK